MDIFVARQAIYDCNNEIYAYELLYRNSSKNTFDASINPQSATYQVINNIILVGLETLVKNKKAFINCDEVILADDVITLLNKDKVVIEILETVEATESVLNNMKKLVEAGYEIALDDVENIESIDKLIQHSKYIKVDFLLSTKEERANIARILKPKNKILLAEKIESEEEYKEAIKLGYSLFQGYYFSKPKVIKNKNIEMKSGLVFLLLEEFNKEKFDIDYVERILKSDVGLMYRFFKFINSAQFSFVQEVINIRQAVMLIGREQLRKWLVVVGLSDLFKGTGKEYQNNSLIRAKFCENIVGEKYDRNKQSEAFITGIFSDIHIVLSEDIDTVLCDLPVSKEIKDALKGENNYLRMALDLVLAYEKIDVNAIELLSLVIGIEIDRIRHMYFESIEWVNRLELN